MIQEMARITAMPTNHFAPATATRTLNTVLSTNTAAIRIRKMIQARSGGSRRVAGDP